MNPITDLKAMATVRVAEVRSRAMTRLANRSFATNPTRLDQIAIAILNRVLPPDDEIDPELDHSNFL